jgi:dinuclear metal center YbgI/SA1388 family protein
MAVSRSELELYLNSLLKPECYQDYCPNGLQVEGSDRIEKLVSGVTACQALIDAAVAVNADAIFVHHGYFWRGEQAALVGMKGRRIRTLMQNDMSLFAYHLPLDHHIELGNNAGLGRILGVESWAPVGGEQPVEPVFTGALKAPMSLTALALHLEAALGRSVITVGEGDVQQLAWCTGGGQGYIEHAADLGVDVFITGEISEQTVHTARERGIAFIAAGHHATERFGVQSVGEHIATRFDLEYQFIDIDSPA